MPFGLKVVLKKTRTKVVHKNVSQDCHKIRKYESEKVSQPLHSINKRSSYVTLNE